jgi:hypothetical protein
MSEPNPLTDDPEILALLDFEPVPRKRVVEGAWTPELQKEFIARLAVTGSPGRACDEMGKNDTGIMKLYRNPEGAGFKAAWDAAIDLAKRRRAEARAVPVPVAPGTRPPSIDNRRKRADRELFGDPGEGLPGQVLNEHGEWEDEASLRRRGLDAADRVGMKLVRCRRAYLSEISGCPGKRAAFEILTELPVDWKLAEEMLPQPFEPWTRTSMRQSDMVLTVESGWAFGEIGYGPDKKKAAREAFDQYRAEQGLEPIDWDAE